jgi:D-alanine-D-alanine ligase
MHTRVAIIRGGPSDEHDVSIRSGQHAIQSLDSDLFSHIDIVITKSGEWLRHGRSRTPGEALYGADVAFIALHGPYGEDGGVQREIQREGVPYVGSEPYAAAIALNKAIAKDHVQRIGVRVPRHMVVGRSALGDTARMARSIRELFGTTHIVKPIRGGSSLGVRIAKNELELAQALYDVLVSYEQALVEEYIHGREATVGVIEGFRGIDWYALPPIEIRTPGDFFDYETRYGDTDHTIVPSSFSIDEKRTLERTAIRVHQALGLRHYSRSDFIVARDGIYFIEANALPGLTERSLIPKALHAVGSSTKEFLTHVLTHALHAAPRVMA